MIIIVKIYIMHIINENAEGQIQDSSYSQQVEKKKCVLRRKTGALTVLVCVLFLTLKAYTHGHLFP